MLNWEHQARNWQEQQQAHDAFIRAIAERSRRVMEQVKVDTHQEEIDDAANNHGQFDGTYHKTNIVIYTPVRTANAMEFNSAQTEVHQFGFLVKTVDVGYALELQIEERSGRVTRLTTTENAEYDIQAIEKAIIDAFHRMVKEMEI